MVTSFTTSSLTLPPVVDEQAKNEMRDDSIQPMVNWRLVSDTKTRSFILQIIKRKSS